VPGAVPWPDLTLDASGLEPDLAEALLRAGRRAHAPYGRCPAAVALRLPDGRLIVGSLIESVAFNPTISPLQSALIGLHADGGSPADRRHSGAPRGSLLERHTDRRHLDVTTEP